MASRDDERLRTAAAGNEPGGTTGVGAAAEAELAPPPGDQEELRAQDRRQPQPGDGQDVREAQAEVRKAESEARRADGGAGDTDEERAQAAGEEGAARRRASQWRQVVEARRRARREGAVTEDRLPDPKPDWRQPLIDRPTIRSGVYAWAVIGIVGLAYLGLLGLGRLQIVFVPLLLALFPAAVLAAPTKWLKRYLPPALAALVVLLSFLGLLGGLVAVLAPSVASELGGLGDTAQEGAQRVQTFLEEGPLGFEPIRIDDLIQRGQDALANTEGLASTVLGYAGALLEGTAGLLFGLVVLFFYLKDGPRIARWLRDLFPERIRRDADVIGSMTWQAVSGYIRGQLLIAFVDAVLIGLALWILGVPLVLPLFVLVFFSGLFPIVGALVSGLVAVLVALATTTPLTALILLGVILAVQEIEGDVLAPLVLGRAVSLHPLAVLAALAAGGTLLGVLGAFIAIPVAGSAARAVGYLRARVPG